MDTMHKPRLNMHTQKHTRPNRLCTWKTTIDVQRKCQGSLQLLSPPFLMTSTMKQMQPNGKEVTRGGADQPHPHPNGAGPQRPQSFGATAARKV